MFTKHAKAIMWVFFRKKSCQKYDIGTIMVLDWYLLFVQKG